MQNSVNKRNREEMANITAMLKLYGQHMLESFIKVIILKAVRHFVHNGLSAPAKGLFTCIKAFIYIPGPGAG